MQERQVFGSSDSEQSQLEALSGQKAQISILKHLSAARRILEGQNRTYDLYSPRCLFEEELTRTGKHLMPKAEETIKTAANRLFSIEDALFQYGRSKEKTSHLGGKKDEDNQRTLWDNYSEKDIYYFRIEPIIKKNNFANIFLKVAGVDLQSKLRLNNFPQIKPSTATKLAKNNGSLYFDSHFQSGNLLYVYKSNNFQAPIQTYDLILHNDINTKGHNQWFYFKMTSTKKNQKVRIRIVNLIKKQSLFSYGFKPLTFSDKNKNNSGWNRNGIKLIYEENDIRRENTDKNHYTLCFQYDFREPFETVYFAPSLPYTYSQLFYFLDSLMMDKRYTNFLSIKKLCQTAGKNAINIVTIATGKQGVKQSKIIWILARQHPFQTTSSFMIEGVINNLLDIVSKAYQKGETFYDNFIFKIIPMVNPDGVIHGNSRAQITGLDPNRCWKKPSKTRIPSIYHIKKEILKNRDEVCMVLDLHSSSSKLGCFLYGNYNQIDIRSYRMYPSHLCNNDPRFFYKNCRFRGGDDGTARKVLHEQLKIPNIFTVECSLLGYVKDNRINEYKIADYYQMGAKLIDTFFMLQKQIYLNNTKCLPQYPHEGNDCCDAQSARSDSCLSDQQYQQIYNLGKNAKKKQKKARSNTFIPSDKMKKLEIGKKKDSTQKIEKNQPTGTNEDIRTINSTNKEIAESLKSEAKRQFSIRLKKNKPNIIQKINFAKPNNISREKTSTNDYKDKIIIPNNLLSSNQNVQGLTRIKQQKKLRDIKMLSESQPKQEDKTKLIPLAKQNSQVMERSDIQHRRAISNLPTRLPPRRILQDEPNWQKSSGLR